MRWAIISDIHANRQALETVLREFETLAVERVVCLGDVVGYGGDPRECLRLVRERCAGNILGNHDAAAVGLTPVEYFNPVAREAARWTGDQLSEPEREYLRGLPLRQDFGPFETVHATPDDPTAWRYLYRGREAAPLFDEFTRRVLFYGHTHQPAVYLLGPEGSQRLEARDFVLGEGERAIINPGSVGQPRDGDPRAAFAICDDSRGPRVTFHRLPYDLEGAQRRILEQGLPPVLASRLAIGA